MDARSHQLDRLRRFTKALDPVLVDRIVDFAKSNVPDEAYCFGRFIGEGEDKRYGVSFEWEEDGLKFQTVVMEDR